MRIIKATTTGMCFGVRDALNKINSIAEPTDVTIHGEIVHNETVLVQLGVRGFHMSSENDREGNPPKPKVLITAHGISDYERNRLLGLNKELIDTTCPLVTRVHHAAQSLRSQGYFILVVGRRNHVEVRGIVEDLDDYTVVENDVEVRSYSFPRIGVVCQTTTSPVTVAAVRQELVFRNPAAEIRFLDTTCAPTRDNQKSLDELLPQIDAVIVVGGKNSNNTRELAARCQSAGKAAFHVGCANDLNLDSLRPFCRIGLVAGTSTLDETVDQVEQRLRAMASQQATTEL